MYFNRRALGLILEIIRDLLFALSDFYNLSVDKYYKELAVTPKIIGSSLDLWIPVSWLSWETQKISNQFNKTFLPNSNFDIT